MLEVRRLRLLSELARRGTIVEVARAVGYTASAVSQSLAQLEREVGVPLLERDGRGVRLTPAARGLVERADRILAELDVAEAELAAEHGVVGGRVVIGAFPSAAAELVAPAIGSLASEHPDLTCIVHEQEPEDGVALLRAGELDVLVTESYDGVDLTPSGGLDRRPLLTEPMVLVLAAGRSRPSPRLADYADSAWIAGFPGTQYAVAFENACRGAGFTPRQVHRADEAYLIQALAAAGVGVGLLPALACAPGPAVQYVHTDPPLPARHLHALVRRGSTARPALMAVLEAVEARAQSGSAE